LRPALFVRLHMLRQHVYALALACRHPRTPWYAKAWVALVVAYALSPIDLVPDFVPVLGAVDDLVLIPIGIWVGLRLVPPQVMAECREAAAGTAHRVRWALLAAAAVILIWLTCATGIGWWLWARWRS